HQQLRCVTRQHGIRIKRDHVADELQPARVANDRAERVSRVAPQELVELGKLATLSLPTHPHVLLRIPETWTMEEEEHIFGGISVLRIQRLDARRGSGENFLVALPVLGR